MHTCLIARNKSIIDLTVKLVDRTAFFSSSSCFRQYFFHSGIDTRNERYLNAHKIGCTYTYCVRKVHLLKSREHSQFFLTRSHRQCIQILASLHIFAIKPDKSLHHTNPKIQYHQCNLFLILMFGSCCRPLQ